MKKCCITMISFLLLTSVLGCCQEKVSQKDVCWRDIPFFAMDTGTKDENHQSAESQIKMLKELGYDGIGYWTGSGGLEEVLRQLDLHGLKAFPVYRGISLDNNGPVCPDDVREAIEGLKGRPYASVWLYIGTSKIYENSSPQGDPKAVAMLREIADIAEASGVKIILYPHYDSWLERVEDAVRVAEKVDRPNVGISFNLCHWLKTDDQANLRPVLEMAMPYLFVVTINGADSGGANWSQLIQPLGQGSFDTYILLKELKDLGYFGPVGLQGFGIGGDVYQNLKQSMQAWNALVAKLDEDCQVK